MPEKGLDEYIRATRENPALQAEWSASESADHLVEIAQNHGYEFSREELEQALSAHATAIDRELGDEDLERVAGGVLRVGGGSYYEAWPCKWYVPGIKSHGI